MTIVLWLIWFELWFNWLVLLTDFIFNYVALLFEIIYFEKNYLFPIKKLKSYIYFLKIKLKY